jgi:HSP20 family protein
MLGLSRYRGLGDLFRMFDNFEKDYLGSSTARTTVGFRTDVCEEEKNYLIEAELPGFDKNDINVEIDGGVLTISAEHTEEKEEKDENRKYISRERRFGYFSRSFDVSGIDEDSITGEYKDGVLKLVLPKVQEVLPEKKKIELN